MIIRYMDPQGYVLANGHMLPRVEQAKHSGVSRLRIYNIGVGAYGLRVEG